MDNSAKYVEMCEKAKEIQALHKEFDQIYSIIPNLYGRRELHISETSVSESIIPPDGQDPNNPVTVWLPRLDQLVIIYKQNARIHTSGSTPEIDLNNGLLNNLLVDLEEYTYGGDRRSIFTSVEQVMFDIVMQNCYKKYWDTKINDWKRKNK